MTLVDLIWNAPPACPSRDVVLAEVARVLEGTRERPLRTRLRADVTEEANGRYRAEVTIDGGEGEGERHLEADGCDAIASATAVIIAVAVEGEGAPPPSPSGPSPSSAQTIGPHRASHLELGVAAVVDDFVLPSIAPGAEVTVGWTHAWSTWRLRLTATGSYLPSQSATLQDGPEGGQFSGGSAGAHACFAFVAGAFDVGPCLGADLEVVTGRGVGPAPSFRSQSQTAAFGAATGSVFVAWRFAERVGLFARADALRAGAPPSFVVDPGDEVVLHRSGWGGRFGLGVAFPIF